MGNGIIDTPAGIETYRLYATLHGLKMEIAMKEKFNFPPTACLTRGMALGAAKRDLTQAGIIEPGQRVTRKKTYVLYGKWLESMGYTVDSEPS